MSFKFTPRKNGAKLVTIFAKVHLSEETVNMIRKYMREAFGYTGTDADVRRWLSDRIEDGITRLYDEEVEREEGA